MTKTKLEQKEIKAQVKELERIKNFIEKKLKENKDLSIHYALGVIEGSIEYKNDKLL